MSDILFKHVEILLSGNKNISLFHLQRVNLIIYSQCFINRQKDNKIRLFDLMLKITVLCLQGRKMRC